MTRPVYIAGVLALAMSPVASGVTRVRVDGLFVREGTLLEVTEVVVGQPIVLMVEVRDTSDQPLGVAGGLVDVAWDPNVLRLAETIDNTNDTTNDVRQLFNVVVWSQFHTGVRLDPRDPDLYVDPGDPGNIALKDVGAGQGVPPKLSRGDAELFFTLRFTPIAAGEARLRLAGHDFGVIVTNQPGAAAQIHDVVSPDLTVLEPAETSEPNQGSDTPNDVTDGTEPNTPAATTPCVAPTTLAAMVMLAGCVGVFSRRRDDVRR